MRLLLHQSERPGPRQCAKFALRKSSARLCKALRRHQATQAVAQTEYNSVPAAQQRVVFVSNLLCPGRASSNEHQEEHQERHEHHEHLHSSTCKVST